MRCKWTDKHGDNIMNSKRELEPAEQYFVITSVGLEDLSGLFQPQ